MGLFSKKTPGETAAVTPDVKSDETTPVQSGTPSLANEEKAGRATTATTSESRSISQTEDAPTEKQAAALAETDDTKETELEKRIDGLGPVETEDDESRYPKATQFILITIALCLSVFCMALDNTVSTAPPQPVNQMLNTSLRSSQLPSRRSPTSSRPSTM